MSEMPEGLSGGERADWNRPCDEGAPGICHDVHRHLRTIAALRAEVERLKEMAPKKLVRGPLKGCGVCGGHLASIRGRYPGDEKRTVCPTCLQEIEDDRQAQDQCGCAVEETQDDK